MASQEVIPLAKLQAGGSTCPTIRRYHSIIAFCNSSFAQEVSSISYIYRINRYAEYIA